MSPFLLTLGCLGLHLVFYRIVLLLRWRAIRTERGIFVYHAASFLLVNLAMFAAIVAQPGVGAEWLAFSLGTHGIYSLSFLELWSLTQGSYSLTVLAEIDRLGTEAVPARLEKLADVGRGKTDDRTGALARLGLIHTDGRSLTFAGAAAARSFRLLLFLTNGQPLNR